MDSCLIKERDIIMNMKKDHNEFNLYSFLTSTHLVSGPPSRTL